MKRSQFNKLLTEFRAWRRSVSNVNRFRDGYRYIMARKIRKMANTMRRHVLVLSERDSLMFANALLNPRQPSAKLIEAARRYTEDVVSVDDRLFREAVAQGIADASAGRFIEHDDLMAELDRIIEGDD